MWTLRNVVLAASLPLLLLADFEGGGSFAISSSRPVHAIVGAPMTPASVAGVARRTTRRTVAVTTTAAATTAAATTAAATTSATTQQ